MKTRKIKQALMMATILGTLSVPAMAQEWNAKERFQLRMRGIGILANGDGMVTGTALGTDVDNAYVPELDVTYFFSEHIAAELIAATAEHTVKAGTNTLGDVWVLPPTLTLQYHFTPDQAFSPYIGAGLNYTMFYGEDDKGAFSDLDVDGGVGYALQAGFDYWINENWGFNADVKYVDLDVDVSVNPGALRANDVDLDPFIVGLGVSYRF